MILDENQSLEGLKDVITKQQTTIGQLKKIIWVLPGSVYWKDRDGVYAGHNAYAAQKMKELNLNWDSIIGKTDYELFPEDVANQFRENDLSVMQSKEIKIAKEITSIPGKADVVQLTTKQAIIDNTGNVTGIVGYTVDITAQKAIIEEQERFKKMIEEVNYGTHSPLACLQILDENASTLSARQLDCLCYLVQGMTIKRIARKLNLSPRTVEHYIDTIKGKLNCYSREELIAKALQLQSVKNILFKMH